MKFYGHGIVWDKENNKPLCSFNKEGVLETEDEALIRRLEGLGYSKEPIVPVINLQDVKNEDMAKKYVKGLVEKFGEGILEGILTMKKRGEDADGGVGEVSGDSGTGNSEGIHGNENNGSRSGDKGGKGKSGKNSKN